MQRPNGVPPSLPPPLARRAGAAASTSSGRPVGRWLGGGGGGGSRVRCMGALQAMTIAAAVCSACALLWLVHGHGGAWPAGVHPLHGLGPQQLRLHHHHQQQQQLPPGESLQQPRKLAHPLWWHAPFVSQSGLGTEATMIVESLIQTRLVRADDIYITHSGDTFDHAVLRSLSRSTRNLLSRRQHPQQVADEWLSLLFPDQLETQQRRLRDMADDRTAIAVCHQWFDCWRRPGEVPSNMPGCPCPLSLNRTAFTVARTMFETAGLPAHLAEHAKAMDEVWVPTEFNRQTFAEAGVDPAKLRVVPEGIDTSFWDPARHRPANLTELELKQATGPQAPPNSTLPPAAGARGAAAAPKRPYIFLSVFKWEARKGWKDLVRGFTRAFGPGDPVELWVLARPFMDSGTDFDAKVRSFAAAELNLTEAEAAPRLPRIYASSRRLPDEAFVRVYRSVDALAIPTHGEGWGRPQIEAMAMGLPVITTNWSGPTAFMNERIAYPLAIDGLSVVSADGDPNFFKPFVGQKWAQPSVRHLAQLMRQVYNNPDEARAKGAAARRHVQEHFTPRAVAGVVAQEVERLQQVVRARLERERRSRGDGDGGGAAGTGVRGSLSKKGLLLSALAGRTPAVAPQ